MSNRSVLIDRKTYETLVETYQKYRALKAALADEAPVLTGDQVQEIVEMG